MRAERKEPLLLLKRSAKALGVLEEAAFPLDLCLLQARRPPKPVSMPKSEETAADRTRTPSLASLATTHWDSRPELEIRVVLEAMMNPSRLSSLKSSQTAFNTPHRTNLAVPYRLMEMSSTEVPTREPGILEWSPAMMLYVNQPGAMVAVTLSRQDGPPGSDRPPGRPATCLQDARGHVNSQAHGEHLAGVLPLKASFHQLGEADVVIKALDIHQSSHGAKAQSVGGLIPEAYCQGCAEG